MRKDKSDNWLGHGRPFGSVGKFSKPIERADSMIKPTTFINRYVIKHTPVILSGLLKKSPGILTWDKTYLGGSPPSAMSPVTAYDSTTTSLSRLNVTVRDLVASLSDDLFMFDDVPHFLMKDILFPSMLKCDQLIQSLLKHTLIYYKSSTISEPVMTSSDRLICPLKSESSFVLIPSTSWESSAQNVTSIRYESVDYDTHPWLRDLDYHNATGLKPGDCLFVPGSWYVQSVHMTRPSVLLTLSSSPLSAKVSRSSCGKHDLSKDQHLGVYADHFKLSRAQRDSSKDSLLHYFMFYLGDSLNSVFTQKQFLRKIKRDKKLWSTPVEWTSELTEITNELFDLLDTGSDGSFSLSDCVNLSNQVLDSMASQIQDRLHDYGAVMGEQSKLRHTVTEKKSRVEPPTPRPVAKAKATAAPGDDFAKAFKDSMETEMNKMLKDMEKEILKEGKSAQADSSSARKERREEVKKAKATQSKDQPKPSESKEPPTQPENFKLEEEREEEIIAEEEDIQSSTPRGSPSPKKPAPHRSSPPPATPSPSSKSTPTDSTQKSQKTGKHKERPSKKEEL